jgi:hypothetical protein
MYTTKPPQRKLDDHTLPLGAVLSSKAQQSQALLIFPHETTSFNNYFN